MEFSQGIPASTPWADWVPTITGAGSGAVYSVTAARWKRDNGRIHVEAQVLITTAGTGAGALGISLPVNAVRTFAGAAHTIGAATGVLAAIGNSGASQRVDLTTAAGGSPVVTGTYLTLSCSYEG